MSKIIENLRLVNLRIKNAARDHKRNDKDILLLAVSKKHGAKSIIEAYHAGQRDFGENYLQEALDKMEQLRDMQMSQSQASFDIHWHFIGPIQSNKTKAIAENFHWVHSVDRLKVAERLSRQRPDTLTPLNLCIQINIDDEQSKSGIPVSDLDELAKAILELPNINLRGLMAIPKAGDSNSAFAKMQQLFEQMKASGHYPVMDTLSMGMSGDLEQAIANGSTLVRIGTDIFGARPG